MISSRWLEKRKAHWKRLEYLVEASRQRSISALRPEELQELALLYRQVASDLSTVREDPASTQLATYLNRILGRAHNLIYMGRKASTRGIWNFYWNVYPAVFRETFSDTFAAFTIFLAAAAVGVLLSIADASFLRHFLGPQMMDTIEQHKMWTDSIVSVKPAASSAILTNNISVCFATFALGITAGIGTIYMMLLNGLLIGIIGAACWREGMSLSLWSFVAAHGSLELPAIFISGGAGIGIARGLLFPGQLPRRLSLVLAGSRSVRLILGTVPMLIVAGLVEGFISPSPVSPVLKFSLAAVLGILLVLYLSKRPPKPAVSSTRASLNTIVAK
ncbi:MAG: stage II sporulation protein M [Acidobacteria bacterium]|nr:stage II sporulation protein M [Acidobacteriota bacterium]MBS1865452.1 stage II sporulation protein M [Acidobacteriota bacterium]